MSVPCASFDWGAAAELPYLPAVRYRRTILSPARWLLTAADLPGPAAGWPQWHRALADWEHHVGLPHAVYLGDGDQRIGLDLSDAAHRALLREHLRRADPAVLRAAPDSDATGWTGGYVHEIVIPLAATARPADLPPWRGNTAVVGRDHGHLPGCPGRVYLKLYGRRDRQDAILTRHLPHLLDELPEHSQWWFLRYRDPDEHLRLRVTTPPGTATDDTAACIGGWTQRLHRAGLIARAHWDTDFPETARFGGATALPAAEACFAADSTAAVAQLTAAGNGHGPDPQALAAASMLDLTIGLIGGPAAGMTWLIHHARAKVTAPPRPIYDQAVALANPHDHTALATQPGGEQVLAVWERRRQALAAYRRALAETGTTPAAVLPDLLHLHHARMAGVELAGETACLHLARAAALSWTVRAGNRS